MTTTKRVQIGSKVEVMFDHGEKNVFCLVLPSEANPLDGKISTDSPFGLAVMGAVEGERLHYKINNGLDADCRIAKIIS